MKLYGEPTLIMFMKGSSSGATLNFALRSKGGGGQPSYLCHKPKI